jgi:hypothetical protein
MIGDEALHASACIHVLSAANVCAGYSNRASVLRPAGWLGSLGEGILRNNLIDRYQHSR